MAIMLSPVLQLTENELLVFLALVVFFAIPLRENFFGIFLWDHLKMVLVPRVLL